MRSLIRDVTAFSSVIPATVQGLFRSGLQVCKTVFDSFGQDVRGAAKVCEIHVFIWIVAAILIADKDHASGDAHFRESCAIVTSAGWKTDVINTALYCRRGQTALDLGGIRAGAARVAAPRSKTTPRLSATSAILERKKRSNWSSVSVLGLCISRVKLTCPGTLVIPCRVGSVENSPMFRTIFSPAVAACCHQGARPVSHQYLPSEHHAGFGVAPHLQVWSRLKWSHGDAWPNRLSARFVQCRHESGAVYGQYARRYGRVHALGSCVRTVVRRQDHRELAACQYVRDCNLNGLSPCW
jgi:hypothetical protein